MYKYENYETVGCSNCMNKQKIKSLIKRFKYLVYFVVGIGGIAMVTLAGSVLLSATQLTPAETLRYDICMGIGCSVIATAVVTVILLALLPENLEEDNELKEWGIDQIYEERGNIQITSNRFPKKNLDFIAFGLQHFRAANPDLDSIVNRIRKGLVIRILAPNPNSIYVIEQQKIENNANIQNDIMQLIEWVNKFVITRNHLSNKAIERLGALNREMQTQGNQLFLSVSVCADDSYGFTENVQLCPTPRQRLENLQRAFRQGIKTLLIVRPVFPNHIIPVAECLNLIELAQPYICAVISSGLIATDKILNKLGLNREAFRYLSNGDSDYLDNLPSEAALYVDVESELKEIERFCEQKNVRFFRHSMPALNALAGN